MIVRVLENSENGGLGQPALKVYWESDFSNGAFKLRESKVSQRECQKLVLHFSEDAIQNQVPKPKVTNSDQK